MDRLLKASALIIPAMIVAVFIFSSQAAAASQQQLYLRDKDALSEEMGDPIPWIQKVVSPELPSVKWEGVLHGDITGSYAYQIDITECTSETQLKLFLFVEKNGTSIPVAEDDLYILPLDPGYYSTYSKGLNGSDLSTTDGDKIICMVQFISGSDMIGIGLDGQDGYSDSHITINYSGPDACFAITPSSGDFHTEFQVDASCTTDEDYPAEQLQVRWDWDGDGEYDTGFDTLKTASHQFPNAGSKYIKLQVKNPDGITRSKVKRVAVVPFYIVDRFTFIESAPVGLTWDGSHIWHSDAYDDKIYRLTPSGIVEFSFDSPCSDPYDLAWDGAYLWVIDAWSSDNKGNLLYKVDPATGSVVSSLQLPADYSTGLTWDGRYLWVADSTNSRLAKVDPDTGQILQTINSPGPNPFGLAWDGQYLWVADAITNNIYQIDTNGSLIKEMEAPGTEPRGLAWDGENLLYVDLDNHTIYKLKDLIPTNISCQLSKADLILGDILSITGQIDPAPGKAGTGVSIELIAPSGTTVYDAVLADINAGYRHTVACGDIDRAGTWTVQTRWSGEGPYLGAVSSEQSLEVSKAESRVTLDVSSRAVRLDDNEKISISGKFTPLPDCGGGLEGIPIKLTITGPFGTETQHVVTNDRWGHFLLANCTGFNALGAWTVRADFAGDDAYLTSSSNPVEVRVVESAGYAIIVQGRISSQEGLASHNKSTELVYKTLKGRGLLDDDIQYFNYDTRTNPDTVDGLPSKTAVKTAITQWARDKMNARPANLYIILVDHGLEDTFYIHPEEISSNELSSWLDSLQSGLTGQAASQEITTILGFCRSGSFVDNLSAANRVTIASAAADESSYKGPLDDDGIREGEYFISEFFKSVSTGKSVKISFEEATRLTEMFTSSGSADSGNAPFFDQSLQHPLLDDNGDGRGSNELNGQANDDGSSSGQIFIGVSGITGNAPNDVQVTQVSQQQFLVEGDMSADLLWARVDDNTRLRTIWVEVKPPGCSPVNPAGPGQAELHLSRNTYDVSNESMQRYEWKNVGDFIEPGTYQIFYFAKDDQSQTVSPLMASTVYKAKSGNRPPKTFDIISPSDGAVVPTSVLLEWQDTSDPEGDRLSYSVLLSKDDMTFNSPIRKEGIEYSACLATVEDGLEDLSTYYWKVQAIDEFGAIQESGIGMFHTNNTNPVSGWIKGHVYDSESGMPLANATLSIGTASLKLAAGGYYLGVFSPGTYILTISASGYVSRTIDGVVVPEGAVVSQDIGLMIISSDEVEAFITRFYQLCLGRDPDAAGLDGWVEALLSSTLTGSDVANGFVFSSEFLEKVTTNEEYLRVLYEAFFNRDPDSAGWAGWMSELDNGTDREHVLRGFIYAKEFNELCYSYRIMPNPVAAFVTRFYQLCLKRDPDITGLNGWVDSLVSGANVGADVAEGFMFSTEFSRSIMSDEEYMRILYKAFFNRDPDAAGLDGWLAALKSDVGRTEVLNGFIYSKEYWELCQNYGIKPFWQQ